MKDLLQLIELPIKVDVSMLTHEEREKLQKKLFEHGVRWRGGSKGADTRSDFNFINIDMELTHIVSNDRDYYGCENDFTEIKIEKLQETLGMKQKQFTKSDLKNGMVVLLRENSDRYLVLNDRIVGDDGWMDFDSYDNDLLEIEAKDSDFDVVEVFEVTALWDLSIQKWELKSIWKREEKSPAQLEIEQIQKQVDELNARLETLKAGV